MSHTEAAAMRWNIAILCEGKLNVCFTSQTPHTTCQVVRTFCRVSDSAKRVGPFWEEFLRKIREKEEYDVLCTRSRWTVLCLREAMLVWMSTITRGPGKYPSEDERCAAVSKAPARSYKPTSWMHWTNYGNKKPDIPTYQRLLCWSNALDILGSGRLLAGTRVCLFSRGPPRCPKLHTETDEQIVINNAP